MTFGQGPAILGPVSRLDRAVLREVLVPFGFAVSGVLVIVFLVQLQRLATAALGLGLTAKDAAVIFIAALPPFLILAVPIAFLLSVVMGLGRMASDREVVALFAAGASPLRLCRAAIASGALVAALCVPLAHYGEPFGLQLLYERLIDVGLRNIASAIQPGVFNEDFDGLALFAKGRSQTGELEDVLVFDERDREEPILLLAARGSLSPHERAHDGPLLQLSLQDGEIHLGKGAGDGRYERVRFDNAHIGIDPGSELRERTRFVSFVGRMSSDEMRSEAARLGPRDRQGRRIEKTYWRRFAFPLMAWVFAFVGAAIVLTGTATARARNALLALSTVALYYVLVRVGDYLVTQYAGTALVSAFGPNVLVLAGAMVFLLRAGRPK